MVTEILPQERQKSVQQATATTAFVMTKNYISGIYTSLTTEFIWENNNPSQTGFIPNRCSSDSEPVHKYVFLNFWCFVTGKISCSSRTVIQTC